MRPRVLVDVDGVLADFIGYALVLTNEILGTAYRREDVTEFDFCRALGLRPADAAAVKRRIGSATGMASVLAVYPGAIDGMCRLREVADVYIVTSPWNSNPTWCHDREQWLKQHFDIHHSNIIHTSAKHLVAGDVLVDDKTSTCEEWRAAWPGRTAVLWSTPHNARDLWDGMATNDWDFLLSLVRSVAR